MSDGYSLDYACHACQNSNHVPGSEVFDPTYLSGALLLEDTGIHVIARRTHVHVEEDIRAHYFEFIISVPGAAGVSAVISTPAAFDYDEACKNASALLKRISR